MRAFRIVSCTTLLLLLTSQSIREDNPKIGIGGLYNIVSSERLQELLQFQEQLLYYYPNLENLASKADASAKEIANKLAEIRQSDQQILSKLKQAEKIGRKRLYDELVSVVQDSAIKKELDNLSASLARGKDFSDSEVRDTLSAIYKIYRQSLSNSFVMEKNPFLGIDLYSLGGCEITKSGSLEIVSQILKAIEATENKSLILDSINDGTITYANLLPEPMREQWKKDMEKLSEANKTNKPIGGEYNRTLLLLRTISPKIKKIVNGNENIDCSIIDAFIKVEAENKRIEILQSFVSKNVQSTILTALLPNSEEGEEIMSLLQRYNQLTKMPASLLQAYGGAITEDLEENIKSQIEDYKRNSGRPLFETKKKVLDYIDTIIDYLLTINLAGKVDNIKSYADFTDTNKVSEELQERYEEFTTEIATKEFNFADPINKQGDKFWMRLRLSDATVKELQQQGFSEDAQVAVSLVYQPRTKKAGQIIPPEEDTFKVNQQIKERFKELAKEKEKFEQGLNKLFVEIGTGLTVHKVNIRKVSAANSKFTLALPDGKTIPINLEMPNIGIKTRLEYKRGQFIDFVNQLQLSQTLGFQLKDIGIAPETWEPTFYFTWKPDGLLSEMAQANQELREIAISLSELNRYISRQDPKQMFQIFLVKKLAEQLDKFVRDSQNQAILQRLLMAEKIENIRIFNQVETLAGEATIRPWGATIFGIEEPIKIQFKVTLKDGDQHLAITAPKINIEPFIRNEIKTYLDPILESFGASYDDKQLSVASFNVLNKIQIISPIIDFENKSICGNIKFNGRNEAKFCVDEDGPDLSGIESLVKGAVQKYVEDKIEELVFDHLEKVTARAIENPFQTIDSLCNKIDGDTIKIFTYNVIIANPKCNPEGGFVEASAFLDDDPDIEISVRVFLNGRTEITGIDSKKLREKLIVYVKGVLPDNGYIKIANPRFEGKEFAVDTRFEMSTLNMDVTLGSLRIQSNGKIYYDGNSNIEEKLLVAVSNTVKEKLNQQLVKTPAEISFGEASGFTVTRVKKFDLANSDPNQRIMELATEVKFPIKKGSLPPLKVNIVFDIPNLKPRKIDLDSIENYFLDILAPLLGPISIPSLGVTFESITPRLNPIRIEGDLNIVVAGVFSMPSTRFTLSEDGFKFTLSPEFTIPTAIPIAPFVVIIDPKLKLDTKNKLLSGMTRITLGATEEARATENIARVNAQINLSYHNVGDINYHGDLVVGSMLPVMSGSGKISVSSSYFEMKESTSGLARKVVEYDKEIVFDGEQKYAQGSAAFNMLGIVSLEYNVKGSVFAGQFKVDGIGRGSIPLVDMKMGAGTIFQPGKPASILRNAYAYLTGEVDIADFEVSNLAIEADMYRARTSFEVLGTTFALTVPIVTELDEEDILELIMSMFAFDPLAMISVLKDIKNIRFNNISFDKVSLPVDLANQAIGSGVGGKKGNKKEGDEKDGEDTGNDNGKIATNPPHPSGKDNTINFYNMKVGHVGYDSTWTTTHTEKVWVDIFDWFSKTITTTHIKHKFNWPQWPTNFNHCLPSDYSRYSCLYYPSIPYAPTEYQIQDIIAPIENTGKRIEQLGSEQGFKFIFARSRVNNLYGPQSIDGKRYLCLNDPDYSNSTDLCIEVSDNFPTVFSNYYINVAYKSDEAYLFLSYDIQNPNCSGTDEIVTTKKVSLKEYRENKFSYSEIEFSNCKLVNLTKSSPTPEPLNIFKLININSLDTAFIYNKSERSINKRLQSYLGYSGITFSAFIKKIIDQKTDTIIRKSASSDETSLADYKKSVGDSIRGNYEWIENNLFKMRGGFLSDQSLIIPLGEQMIIVDDRTTINLITRERTGNYDPNYVKNILPQLTGKIWKSIDYIRLQQAFPEISNGSSLEASFNYIRDNIKEKSIKLRFDKFLRNLLIYGKTPSVTKVNLSPYEFLVWDLSKVSESAEWGFEYEFDNSKENLQNLHFLDTSKTYIPKSYSPLLDSLGIIEHDLMNHRDFLEDNNNQQNHIYPNYLFYSMALEKREEDKTKNIGTASTTALARIKNDELLFITLDSVEANDSYYRLTKLKPGNLDFTNTPPPESTFINPDVRDSLQLCFIGFTLNGISHNSISSTMLDNYPFFSQILKTVEANETTKAFISRKNAGMTDDDNDLYRYRALVFTDNQVELIWEPQPSKKPKNPLIVDRITFFDNFSEALSGRYKGFGSQRIARPTDISNKEKALIIFQGLDGSGVWFKGKKMRINPLAIFNQQFQRNNSSP